MTSRHNQRTTWLLARAERSRQAARVSFSLLKTASRTEAGDAFSLSDTRLCTASPPSLLLLAVLLVDYLGDLAKAEGDTLVMRAASVGGASMELHWSKAEALEKDPADKLGRYANGKSLKEELTGGHWDFVTFQQASLKSHDLATYRPFAKQLSDYIGRYAPDAALLLHETWEYRIDDPRFSKKTPAPAEPKTQDEMYRGLANAYATIAKELGVRRLPVGEAFHLANRDPQWGFHAPGTPFDSKHAQPGELPDQTHSLNVGWTWKKLSDGRMTISLDGHHASKAGEYLGACVWYEVLFGKSVENNPFVPAGLEAEYAKFLRATAHRVVMNPDAQKH